MIVVGNDLIDLSVSANINTFSRPGIEKFFSKSENKFIEALNNKNAYSFLWAMKESIYKCMLKFGYKMAFNPVRINIEVEIKNNVWHGNSIVNNKEYFTYCHLDENNIKCVASNSLKELSKTQSFVISNSSNSIYNDILAKLKHKFAIDKLIKTDDNIPILISDCRKKYLDISLSSEGEYYLVSYLPKLMNLKNCAYLNSIVL